MYFVHVYHDFGRFNKSVQRTYLFRRALFCTSSRAFEVARDISIAMKLSLRLRENTRNDYLVTRSIF